MVIRKTSAFIILKFLKSHIYFYSESVGNLLPACFINFGITGRYPYANFRYLLDNVTNTGKTVGRARNQVH